MPTIYDNKEERLGDGITEHLRGEVSLDACVGYFNVRGWGLLAGAVESLVPPNDEPAARILVGMLSRPDVELREELRDAALQARGVSVAVDGRRMAAELQRLLDDFRVQLVLGVPTAEDLRTLVDLRNGLRSRRVRVRAFLGSRLHAKLYIVNRRDAVVPRVAYVGSSNLTHAGLRRQGELNIDVLDADASDKLATWFADRWDDVNARDISEELADLIDDSWVEQTAPLLVHLKMAYHLSRDAREGQVAFDIPADIGAELLDFQAAAVRMAARTLQRRRGVMIGDVVGLGKTLTATAIARVMEEAERVETLILCPKNLEAMWHEYLRAYQLRGARVLPLSIARHELPNLARYRLVIVDESHNLRNAGTQTYSAVRDYIDRNEPYVVLITATPYNVDYSDIADQLALFLAPTARLQLRPDRAIEAAGGLAPFLQRLKNGIPESLEAFRRSEDPEDWRALMSQFLVRRTRGFIKKHYAEHDERGSFIRYPNTKDDRFYFPLRKPKVVAVPEGADVELRIAGQTIDTVSGLRLARQRLGHYLTEAASQSDDPVVDRLLNRSASLQGIVRIGLLKRLSSSRAALMLSLQRHLIRDLSFIYALDRAHPIPVGAGALVDADLAAGDGSSYDTIDLGPGPLGQGQEGLSSTVVHLRVEDDGHVPEISRQAAEQFAAAAYRRVQARGTSVTWLDASLVDSSRLRADLSSDIDDVERLLQEIGSTRAADDPKLRRLVEILTGAHAYEKVLVFTEYRDTADYVAFGLRALGLDAVAAVSGATDDPTAFARRFSPKSNEKIGGLPSGQQELRVLVATDVLSEGQNLQDSRVVVNYDLPWATLRIVQRAGRVDRIGQQASEVLVYTFDVGEGLDTTLRLRQRIVERLNEAGAVLGSDDRFFGTEKDRELLEGLYDEKRANALDDLLSDDVDPSSFAYELWRSAIAADPSLEPRVMRLPNGIRTTIARTEPEGNAVLTLVTSEFGIDSVVLADRAGEVRPVAPIPALRATAVAPETLPAPSLENHLELVAQCVARVSDNSQSQTGMLTGVRKRVYQLLLNHERVREGLFADHEARAVVDDLYRRPLTQSAAQRLDAKLREDRDGLLDLVLALAADGTLLVADEELVGGELTVVGSVGFCGPPS